MKGDRRNVPFPDAEVPDDMARFIIVPIVEGCGEVDAVPILLRNWLSFRRYREYVDAHDAPVFANVKGSITAEYDRRPGRGVEHFVGVAILRDPRPNTISRNCMNS